MNQSWKIGEENATPKLIYIVVEATVSSTFAGFTLFTSREKPVNSFLAE